MNTIAKCSFCSLVELINCRVIVNKCRRKETAKFTEGTEDHRYYAEN